MNCYYVDNTMLLQFCKIDNRPSSSFIRVRFEYNGYKSTAILLKPLEVSETKELINQYKRNLVTRYLIERDLAA